MESNSFRFYYVFHSNISKSFLNIFGVDRVSNIKNYLYRFNLLLINNFKK